MDLLLSRAVDDGQCTTGSIAVGNGLWETLERPWVPGPLGGVPGRSSVPVGVYQLALHDTEAHPRSFALVNKALGIYHLSIPVGQEGRTACLIHVANYVVELRGCIALGVTLEPWQGSFCLRQSRIAVDAFYARVPWTEGHTLTIEGPP